ncbi:MAG TPA: NAD(+)--rifampin ADP-ribosyltransferase, partial [Rhodothermales bacterium]
MEFSPSNPIVQLCLRASGLDTEGKRDEAGAVLETAWNEASNDLERFLAAYFLGRYQEQMLDRLRWLETALQLALRMNDVAVNSALPTLYTDLATAHEESGDAEGAERYRERADSTPVEPSDPGPFFHGTRADLQVGEVLTAGRQSNYQSNLTMNHVYFTASVHGAGLAAALA